MGRGVRGTCGRGTWGRGSENPQSAIRNPQSEIRNPKSAIRNPRPSPVFEREIGRGEVLVGISRVVDPVCAKAINLEDRP